MRTGKKMIIIGAILWSPGMLVNSFGGEVGFLIIPGVIGLPLMFLGIIYKTKNPQSSKKY